ncbi:hypothetical protein GCM10011386_13140 [Parapedobacter defluvii]|uniref:Phage shock protein C (PspC) family protein n=1 Tax=Parapedobacter defluvii TaxID=2045106 RepID=A0ABQ1LH30_9SPHI|nr:PspC domain-containing protein [Parapedobacter defluvii]GGC22625.1 hypothetical protein GCM10011386_13140 [Parapedobacter defluvii]
MEKKLQRIPYEGAVAGVCAGLGAYFGIDKTWVRLAFVLSVFFSGYMGIGLLGPIIYIVLWIVLPIKTFSLPQDPFDVDYRAKTDQEFMAHDRYTPPSTNQRVSKDRYIAGLILLAVGIFFLLHQLDVFYWRDFARYWPVLIILMGLASIVGAFNSRNPSFQNKEKSGTDPEPEPPADDSNGEPSYTK